MSEPRGGRHRQRAAPQRSRTLYPWGSLHSLSLFSSVTVVFLAPEIPGPDRCCVGGSRPPACGDVGEGTDGVTGLKAAWSQVPTVWLLCSPALPGLLCLAPGFICEPGWDPSPHGGPHGSLLASEVEPQPLLTDSWPRARRAHGAAPSSLMFLPWTHESFPFFRSLEKHLDVRT